MFIKSLISLSILSLVACGGGSGVTPTPTLTPTPTPSPTPMPTPTPTPTPIPNAAPVVSITGKGTIQEFERLALSANATDSDGSIDNVIWSVKSGPVVTLIGADTFDVSFIAPDIDVDTTLVLEVQVADDQDAKATGEFSVTITATPPFGDSVLSFLSGTTQGLAVFNDNRLYLSIVGSAGTSSYAKFDNVNDSTIGGGIVIEAPGIGYNVANYVERGGLDAEIASLNAGLNTGQDFVVTRVRGFSVALGSGTFLTSEKLLPLDLLSDLTSLNGLWKDNFHSELTIDSGMNLRTTDGDGCIIDGVVTPTTSGVFTTNLNYSACSKAGSYSGILTLTEFNEVAEIQWMAFNDSNRGVFASVDTQITQDEALGLTSELVPSLYINASKILITKSGQIFTLEYNVDDNTNTPFVFQYTYDDSQEIILGIGEGLPTDSTATNSSLIIPVTPSLEFVDVTIEYEDLNNNLVTKQYLALDYIPSDKLLDSIAGQWGQLTISESGLVSGSVQDCAATGQVSNNQGKLWDISITFAGCGNSGDFIGVIVGAKDSVFDYQNPVVVTSLFNATKKLGVNGILNKQ
ncbi:MAG: hypothetical protein ACI8Z9_000123 [Paraglaciecola sp.]